MVSKSKIKTQSYESPSDLKKAHPLLCCSLQITTYLFGKYSSIGDCRVFKKIFAGKQYPVLYMSSKENLINISKGFLINQVVIHTSNCE